MTVELPEAAAAIVQRLIESGEFKTPEEVVHYALEQWSKRDTDFAPGEVKALLAPALDELKRGEAVPIAEAMVQVRQYIAERSAKRLRA